MAISTEENRSRASRISCCRLPAIAALSPAALRNRGYSACGDQDRADRGDLRLTGTALFDAASGRTGGGVARHGRERPSMDAGRAGGPVPVGDLDARASQCRWPLFAPLAVDAAAGALFALPLPSERSGSARRSRRVGRHLRPRPGRFPGYLCGSTPTPPTWRWAGFRLDHPAGGRVQG
jgi:hypothetical protein